MRYYMRTSFVQVYTGDGKGKTTAAAGLALRAAGRGLRVRFVQFLKGRESGEITALSGMENVEVFRVADCTKFFSELSGSEKQSMRDSVLAALPVITGWLGDADVMVLDEALGALKCGILKTDELLHIMETRRGTEIVITGRDAPREITDKASLVTEMKEIKHYYNEGAAARAGIEF